MISSLPKAIGLLSLSELHQYQSFWFDRISLEGFILAQQHFQVEPADIIISSSPKSGTTWLKALAFAVVTRHRYGDFNSPLLTKLPHNCVPVLEFGLIQKKSNRIPDVPLFSTHTSYTCLPKSIQATPGCKIVSICRDPKDVFESVWCFHDRITQNPLSLEEALEMFCQGLSYRGPYWDHVLGYWNASLELPEKVLFLQYEEMNSDTALHVKRLAELMGCPFTLEEERRDVAQKIVELCSFEKLSNLEVKKTGKQLVLDNFSIENQSFFRKGVVGDLRNHLTAEMVARLDEITEQTWKGSRLST